MEREEVKVVKNQRGDGEGMTWEVGRGPREDSIPP